MRNLATALATALALGAALIATPALAGTTLTTKAGDNLAPAGATTVLTFDNTGSAVDYSAAKGYTLTRAGYSGSFFTSGQYGAREGGIDTTGMESPYPDDGNGFYGVGGKTAAGIQSYAQFLGTKALSSISVFIGSLDSYNQVQLLGQTGNVIATYTGTDLNGGVAPVYPGSDKTTNLRATFTGTAGTTYYGVRFSNTGNAGSLEFDNLAFTAAVPEPATWAMMLVGFGMVAGTARYRRRSVRAAIA